MVAEMSDMPVYEEEVGAPVIDDAEHAKPESQVRVGLPLEPVRCSGMRLAPRDISGCG